MKELGSEVARQAEDSQPTQPNLIEFTERCDPMWKSIHVFLLTARTPTCMLNDQRKTKTLIQIEIELGVVDIDFRVSGLTHAIVKQAENFRVVNS